MLGMVNIPYDSPPEFYAIPERHLGLPESIDDNMNEPSSDYDSTEESNSIPIKRISPNMFNRRVTSQIEYLQDGRKVLNGELVENTPPSKHWEQLIVRTFVHKIEDEIKDPVGQFSTIQSTFSSLTADQRPRSHSTFSLVSRDLPTIQSTFPSLTADQKSRSRSTFSLVSQDLVVSRCEKCCPNQKIAETCRWLSILALDVGVNSPIKSLVFFSNNEARKHLKSESKAAKSNFLTVN